MFHKLFRKRKHKHSIKNFMKNINDFFHKKERERNRKKIVSFVWMIIILFAFGGISFYIYNFLNTETSSIIEKPIVQFPEEEKPNISDEIEHYEPIDGGIETINNNLEFELPINGASGYATINMYLKKSNSAKSETIGKIIKGEAFRIILEKNNWWYVNYKGSKGWVENTYCMINLPDIIPSIIYFDSNSYMSLFTSSGYELPGVSAEKLYDVLMYNERFDKEQFVMPVLYAMAKKINKVQQAALKNGDSLKIYETFRPYIVQRKVDESFSVLISNNNYVHDDINSAGWSESWFICSGRSNHQLGVAIDVSLVKVDRYKINSMEKYKYIEVTDYLEYNMPTEMHDLSSEATVFKYGVTSKSKTAWKGVPLATTMTADALKLQNYFTSFELTPLASEWWHFNDLDARELIRGRESDGRYYLSECVSQKMTN